MIQEFEGWNSNVNEHKENSKALMSGQTVYANQFV